MNDNRVTFRLPTEIAQAVTEIASQAKISESEIVRLALGSYIQEAYAKKGIVLKNGESAPITRKNTRSRLYIIKWESGELSTHIGSGEICWMDELDSIGDPSNAEVRAVSAYDSNHVSLVRSDNGKSFKIELSSSQETLISLFNSSEHKVWPVEEAEPEEL